jgi:hypothetical protein
MFAGAKSALEPIAVFQIDVDAKGCVRRSRHGTAAAAAVAASTTTCSPRDMGLRKRESRKKGAARAAY